MASRHPLRSALWLVVSLVATALCYLLLDAAFASLAQMVAYVGAIAVLIVFAIMLLRPRTEPLDRRGAAQILVGLALSLALMLWMIPAFRIPHRALPPAGFGSAESMGRLLLSDALLPFELVSLLLLCAMVSAIVLGRDRQEPS